ncbi:MAG: DUF192 domain-containing protein [Chloroflexota bacterium]|nr:DUF192 domain-containing protein [Chloroflexota bacterium]
MTQRIRRFWAPAFTVALLAFSGCSSTPRSAPATPAPAATATVVTVAFQTADVRAGDRTIGVEVATTPAQRERGLGYRDALDADAGMIFDLHGTRTQQFWMKGMRFALDMVWVDASERVAQVTKDIPPEPGVPDDRLRLYASDLPVAYVIEVNAGASSRLGLAPGAQLTFDLPAGSD